MPPCIPYSRRVYILIVVLLIMLNGVFAMAEIAVVSSNRFRLQQRAEDGNRAAARALALAEDPSRFLSTVQIGITLVGVFAGAYGGATLAEPLARTLATVPALAPYSAPIALTAVVMAITYLSLIIGELVPKHIALANPERVAMALGGLMHGISVAAAPLVWFLGVSTNAVLKLLRVPTDVSEEISEEEIEMVIAQGLKAGVVEPAEQTIIENAFWLGERRVNVIMTPRPEVAWFDVNSDIETILARIRELPHGRYIVADGSLDSLVGYVSTVDLLTASLEGTPLDLRALALEPLIAPETLPILRLLEKFRTERVHLAVIIDEYGGFEGLVTLSDILEELVGDVPEGPELTPEITAVGEDTWLVSGSVLVEDLLELLGLEDKVGRNTGYRTVSGLVADQLQRLPAVADEQIWHGFQWRVEAMAGLRVEQILIRRLSQPDPAPASG